MNPKDRVKLRFGPYKTPRFKYGDVVFCESAGEVVLCGLSKGRIPWPRCRRGKAKAIALFGALADAVRSESGVAVQYWWGVGGFTVGKWRKALGVERLNKGTLALKSDYGHEPYMHRARLKAWAKARDPQRVAKISAAHKGRVMLPHVLEALRASHLGRTISKETRRKMSETHKRLGTRPPHGRVWTPIEDARVRSLPIKDVAKRTGRSVESVKCRRHVLKVADGRGSNGRIPVGGPWTAAQDALLSKLPPKQVAARTGRHINAVYYRRMQVQREGVELFNGYVVNKRLPRRQRASKSSVRR